MRPPGCERFLEEAGIRTLGRGSGGEEALEVASGALDQRVQRILRLPWARALHDRRKTQRERPFAEIKQRMRLRGFSLRGKVSFRSQWDLMCPAFDIQALHRAAEA